MAEADPSALKVAIELVHVPSRARLIKSAPLPEGMGLLLSIAADDAGALAEGGELTGRSSEVVKGAAAFFIEQILFAPDCDSYRILGARETASNGELRRNMALLLRALHPDINQNKDRSVFAGRVTRAWEDLKTQERRQSYDEVRRAALAARAGRSTGTPRNAKIKSKSALAKFQFTRNAEMRRSAGRSATQTGLLRRALAFLLGADKSR